MLKCFFCAVIVFTALYTGADTFAASYRQMDENEKAVYLTFDDGPDPVNTIAVMEVLLRYGVKGTFFFTGVNMNNFPEVTRQVYENGFGIGLHGYAHSPLAAMSASGVKNDIDTANDALEQITGERSLNIRPPYGAVSAVSKSTLDSMGFSQYMWTIDPRDWSGKQTDEGAINEIKENLKPGAIILLHASQSQARAARILPEIIEYILAEGYEIKQLPDEGYKSVSAVKSEAVFLLNGTELKLGAYVIDGVSYVSARELAYALRPTDARFNISWNEEISTVEIETGGNYRGQRTSLFADFSAAPFRVRARKLDASVSVNGVPYEIDAYHINGSSYYNLRRLSSAVKFGIYYDAVDNSVNLLAPVSEALTEYGPGNAVKGEPVRLPAFPIKFAFAKR